MVTFWYQVQMANRKPEDALQRLVQWAKRHARILRESVDEEAEREAVDLVIRPEPNKRKIK